MKLFTSFFELLATASDKDLAKQIEYLKVESRMNRSRFDCVVKSYC